MANLIAGLSFSFKALAINQALRKTSSMGQDNISEACLMNLIQAQRLKNTSVGGQPPFSFIQNQLSIYELPQEAASLLSADFILVVMLSHVH